MNLVMNQLLDSKLTETVVEEEKAHGLEEEPNETTMVLWDCAPMLGLENEEPTKEIQISVVNVETRIKGPLIEDNILHPKIKKISENMKKIKNNTQTLPVPDLVITRHNSPTISKPVKAAENKVESINKISTKW